MTLPTYCHDLHCPHQKAGAIEHFASRGAMDIEGLGEETVLLLIDAGLLVDISDIYKLPAKAEELAKLEMRGTYGEAGARRLLDAIQKSKERRILGFQPGQCVSCLAWGSAR